MPCPLQMFPVCARCGKPRLMLRGIDYDSLENRQRPVSNIPGKGKAGENIAQATRDAVKIAGIGRDHAGFAGHLACPDIAMKGCFSCGRPSDPDATTCLHCHSHSFSAPFFTRRPPLYRDAQSRMWAMNLTDQGWSWTCHLVDGPSQKGGQEASGSGKPGFSNELIQELAENVSNLSQPAKPPSTHQGSSKSRTLQGGTPSPGQLGLMVLPWWTPPCWDLGMWLHQPWLSTPPSQPSILLLKNRTRSMKKFRRNSKSSLRNSKLLLHSRFRT